MALQGDAQIHAKLHKGKIDRRVRPRRFGELSDHLEKKADAGDVDAGARYDLMSIIGNTDKIQGIAEHARRKEDYSKLRANEPDLPSPEGRATEKNALDRRKGEGRRAKPKNAK